jgi:hypothetical protein
VGVWWVYFGLAKMAMRLCGATLFAFFLWACSGELVMAVDEVFCGCSPMAVLVCVSVQGTLGVPVV